LLSLTTLSFDIATLELLLPLVVGATVDIAPARVAMDGAALGARIRASRPSVVQATPATWSLLVATGWEGSKALAMLCGGEALPPALATSLLSRCRALFNVFGPTETTIWSTVERVRDAGAI